MAKSGNPTVVSGASHVIEPADVWARPLGARHGGGVPRMVSEHAGVNADYFFTGLEYVRVDAIVEGD